MVWLKEVRVASIGEGKDKEECCPSKQKAPYHGTLTTTQGLSGLEMVLLVRQHESIGSGRGLKPHSWRC